MFGVLGIGSSRSRACVDSGVELCEALIWYGFCVHRILRLAGGRECSGVGEAAMRPADARRVLEDTGMEWVWQNLALNLSMAKFKLKFVLSGIDSREDNLSLNFAIDKFNAKICHLAQSGP